MQSAPIIYLTEESNSQKKMGSSAMQSAPIIYLTEESNSQKRFGFERYTVRTHLLINHSLTYKPYEEGVISGYGFSH